MPDRINTLSFKGGYRFRGFQGASTDELVALTLGSHASIPLGSAGSAVVKRGEQIDVGQIVGESDHDFRRLTVSPVSGTVAAVSDDFVQIDCGGDQAWPPVPGASAEWKTLSTDVMEDVLLATGSCSVVRGGLPTRHGTSELAPEEVRRVVVHDSGSEVYRTSVAVLMRERDTTHLSVGLAILQRLFPNSESHVVMGAESLSALPKLNALGDHNGGGGPSLHLGSPKYPQHHESVLLESLFGEEVPARASAVDYGALVMDVQALLQIRDAVVTGKPNIERVIPLSGPGFTSNPHVQVRVGTSVERVIEPYINRDESPKIVYNSVMTGEQVDDTSAPIGFDCTGLVAIPKARPEFLPFMNLGGKRDSFSFTFLSSLVRVGKTLDDNLHGEERACLACGYCEQICPAGILPFVLHRYVQRKIIDEKLVRYGAFRCIDCNLCTYVCPSKIPLARLIADGKQALRDEGFGPAPAVESKEGAV
ncbi:MAG: 4Fe-4S dicluster domain-containing protein [Spirochaetales bacterium]|nr:4Fe-4S dicluster domain-containing protein [Spirochaetales bacterium]